MVENKKKLFPRLRFPEFRDAGPWEVRSIEQVTIKVVQGGTPKTSVPEYWNGEIPWITPAEMGDDATHHYTESTLRAISRQGLENSSAELLPANSVIISSRAPIGYVTINKVEMATNQGCKGLIPNKDIYHEFLYFSLLRTKQRLNDLGAGAGFKEISTSALKAFKILVPNILEQQKIADCLSSLDEVIELEAKKLKALEEYKKGLMQKLFPREGETTPRLRFPEFRDAGEWEMKRLGEVCFNQRSELNAGDLISDGMYNVYGASGVIGKHNSYQESEPYISIIKDGSGAGTVIWCEPKTSVLSTLEKIKPKSGIVLRFLYYVLKNIDFLSYMVGGAIPHVYFSNYASARIAIPSLEKEQQKIADCLSSLDEVIELQTKKLELLKAHKKGLMQQLFPREVG